MLTLRDYQLEALETLWNSFFTGSSFLCVVPTGGGKTEIMMELIRKGISRKPDLKTVVLLNKIDLVKQTERRFKKLLGTEHIGVYCGSEKRYERDAPVTVASIQSIFDVDFDKVNLLVIDEVHNVDMERGRYLSFIEALRAKNEKLKILGFTATPFRADGPIYGKGKLFPAITYHKKINDLIALGYLVEPRLKAPQHQLDVSQLRVRMGEYVQEDVQKITENLECISAQVPDSLERLKGRRKAVWACASIKHAEMIYAELVRLGETASIIHSQQSDTLRNFNKTIFEQTKECRHLVFITIVSEGYDFPPIDAVILMRPIKSPVLYLQTVGRGLRICEGKKDCLVLDYGNVISNVGPLDNPRFPDFRGKAKDKDGDEEDEQKMRQCPKCREIFPAISRVCPCCDYVIEEKKPDLTQKPNETGALFTDVRKPLEMEIDKLSLIYHKSANGNVCLKLAYHPKNFFALPIHEYFTLSNAYSLKRMHQRLLAFGVDFDTEYFKTFEPGAHYPVAVKYPPKRITYIYENKYARILGYQLN